MTRLPEPDMVSRMKRDEIVAILLSQRAELEKLGVAHLSIFGSVARDEADAESDLDLLISPIEGRPFGFFAMSIVIDEVQKRLPKHVDLLIVDSLRNAPRLEKRVMRDAVHVF
jgi:uncharacterized protein